MVKLQKSKLWKTGNSWVVSIPKAFIDNGYIDTNKTYEVELIEKNNSGEKICFSDVLNNDGLVNSDFFT